MLRLEHWEVIGAQLPSYQLTDAWGGFAKTSCHPQHLMRCRLPQQRLMAPVMGTLKIQEAGVHMYNCSLFVCVPSSQGRKAKMFCSVDSSGVSSDWVCAHKLLVCQVQNLGMGNVCVQAHDWLNKGNSIMKFSLEEDAPA